MFTNLKLEMDSNKISKEQLECIEAVQINSENVP